MKYLKIFEEFERGGLYPLSEKQCRYVKDNYPWINDPSYIKTDGTYYFLGEDLYDSLEDALGNILGHFGIENYEIKNDKLDVKDDVVLDNRELKQLPFIFGHTYKKFSCKNNKLTSLYGSPKYTGYFDCSKNLITTLQYAPEEVDVDFNCSSNTKLKTLEGGPKKVFNEYIVASCALINLKGVASLIGANLDCSHNSLESLEGIYEGFSGKLSCHHNKLKTLKYCPNKLHSLYCSYNELNTLQHGPTVVEYDYVCDNNELSSLLGSPEVIKSNFDCSDNKLESLENGPTFVEKNYDCSNNKLTSLVGISKKIGGKLICNNNQLKHLLDLPDFIGRTVIYSKNDFNGEPSVKAGIKYITLEK